MKKRAVDITVSAGYLLLVPRTPFIFLKRLAFLPTPVPGDVGDPGDPGSYPSEARHSHTCTGTPAVVVRSEDERILCAG